MGEKNMDEDLLKGYVKTKEWLGKWNPIHPGVSECKKALEKMIKNTNTLESRHKLEHKFKQCESCKNVRLDICIDCRLPETHYNPTNYEEE